MGKAGRKLKVPKAKMEGINVKALQSLLFYKKEYPEYFNKYSDSKELMMVFKLLVAQPSAIEEGLEYELDIQEKLHHVFGTDYRTIYTYEVVEDFILNVGEVLYLENMPEGQPPRKLRALYKGDIVLIRVDTRDEDLTADLQVLTSGLFQDTSDDFRNFKIDIEYIKQFRNKLKLVDKDGQDEETFIGDTRR
jgi:hypothetical protein